MPDKFYITTAISYPNGRPHIGHAYELIATDALARFHRLDGHDVFFLTGTDEHGQKMMQTARREGIPVRELADRNAAVFREMCDAMGASNDDFIRTPEPRHKEACQRFWEKLEANGDIYKGSYKGWYSVRDEAYYDESETEERDGTRYGPQGTPVEWVEEESYFFRLSNYADKLLELYERNPDFVQPRERLNEVRSFVSGGLRDLSLSRTTFDWGVPVPGDEKHVMYVWIDALMNYVTATSLLNENKNGREGFWPADLHVIGKDIVRFHAVYWPAFLMSAGMDLPQTVFGHGFLFNRGEKMSKSVGNVIDPFALAETYGLDQLRYFLLREVPFGQDGSYSHDAIVNRVNADLANDLGNLAQRSLSMIAKNCDGAVPIQGALTEEDRALLCRADALGQEVRDMMTAIAPHRALAAIFDLVAETNRYFANQEPWALKKTDPERMGTVLFNTAEVVRQVAILCQPFMPTSTAKLLDVLGVNEEARSFASLGVAGRLDAGTPLPKPTGIFPRYVEAE